VRLIDVSKPCPIAGGTVVGSSDATPASRTLLNTLAAISFRTSDSDCGISFNFTTDDPLQMVRDAWVHFQSDSWLGGKPTLETVFEVSLIITEQRFSMSAREALEAHLTAVPG
jgi:hypothetical protein